MGFECMFYRAKKYDVSTDISEVLWVDSYIEWKNNPWNIESGAYPTYEAYWHVFCNYDTKDEGYPGEPPCDMIRFYENNPVELIQNWCSSGNYFDSVVCNALNRIDEYHYDGINKDFIDAVGKMAEREVESNSLVPAYISKSIVEKSDGSSVLYPCDGIVYSTEGDDSLKILYTSGDYDDCVYVPKVFSYDYDKYRTFSELHILTEQLKMIDMDKWLVWYERSF